MKRTTRIHFRLEPSKPPFRDWTFDQPEKVSIGFSSDAMIWVVDESAGPLRNIVEKKGGEYLLRLGKDLHGMLKIDGQEIPFQSLREVGVLKEDRKGEYVVLKEKTSGTLILGKAKAQFWLTAAPSQPEFPTHPKIITLLREIPLLFVVLFCLYGSLEAYVISVLRTLPSIPEPDILEVNSRFARILIPNSDYIDQQIKRMNASAGNTSTPPPKISSQGEKRPPKPPLSTGGLLTAVVSKRGDGKSSPFAGLFSASSLGKTLEGGLNSEGFEKAMAQNLATASTGLSGTGSHPQTVGIGTIEIGKQVNAALSKKVTGPQETRLSADIQESAPTGDIDRGRLEQLVASRAGELRECYERALARNPSLHGKAVFRLVLRAKGAPIISADEKSTLSDPALSQCIIAKMGVWPFEIPARDTGPIVLPFIFSAASKG